MATSPLMSHKSKDKKLYLHIFVYLKYIQNNLTHILSVIFFSKVFIRPAERAEKESKRERGAEISRATGGRTRGEVWNFTGLNRLLLSNGSLLVTLLISCV